MVLSIDRSFCIFFLHSGDILVYWLCVVTDLDFEFIHVVFEVPFALCAIWENHLSISVLDAFDPFSLITATVGPVHFSVAVALILSVFAFIDVAARPLEDAIALFSVVVIITLIAVAEGSFCTAPLTLTFFHASPEVTNIRSAINPGVLTLAFRFAIVILTSIGVPI